MLTLLVLFGVCLSSNLLAYLPARAIERWLFRRKIRAQLREQMESSSVAVLPGVAIIDDGAEEIERISQQNAERGCHCPGCVDRRARQRIAPPESSKAN